jgi:hypothetical protein
MARTRNSEVLIHVLIPLFNQGIMNWTFKKRYQYARRIFFEIQRLLLNAVRRLNYSENSAHWEKL